MLHINKKASGENPEAFLWQGWQGSNPQPTDLESATLPIELHPCVSTIIITKNRVSVKPG